MKHRKVRLSDIPRSKKPDLRSKVSYAGLVYGARVRMMLRTYKYELPGDYGPPQRARSDRGRRK